MIFLIEYDRPKGTIVQFKSFPDSQRVLANDRRLEMELDLNRRAVDHEVALLEAADEKALRLTHRRYFQNLDQIGGMLISMTQAAKLRA